jgi:hypothetical protein
VKVFISWSGKRSQMIAEALHWWLRNILRPVRPFISKRDILKGVRGMNVIAESLEQSGIGLICLTPENQNKPWILFEAGALSKIATSHVCTVLCQLDPADVQSPLGQFQHTKTSEDDLLALASTINGALDKDHQLEPGQLYETFIAWWPQLKEKLDKVPQEAPQDDPASPPRNDTSLLKEILDILRNRERVGDDAVIDAGQTVSEVAEIGAVPANQYYLLLLLKANTLTKLASLPVGDQSRVFSLQRKGLVEVFGPQKSKVVRLTPAGKKLAG